MDSSTSGNGIPSEDATQNLPRAAAQGDAWRFSELCERVAPALVAWCELKVSGPLRETLDPLDIAQETWCRAWKRFHTWNPETTPFRAWLFRIAKNVVLECLRRTRDDYNAAARGEVLHEAPDSATTLCRRLAREEEVQALIQWARSLDAEEYAMFMHVGLEGLTYDEAGERLGLLKDTVAKRWQSLRERAAQAGRGYDYLD
jgi:RNA polymerase sigma factor (sigma-70 family)